MIKIGFWQCFDFQNNSEYFFKNKKINILGEDAIETFKSLFFTKKTFKYKIELLKLNKFFEYDLIIFANWPINKQVVKLLKKRTKPNYLLALEGPTIDKSTWKYSNHKFFKKVFTWDDSLVRKYRSKYIKINFPCYKNKKYKIKFKKKNFLISISSNKKNNSKNDLYRERLKFINWAEKNNKVKFDFYGYGWNNYDNSNTFFRKIVKKFKAQNFVTKKKFKNYKGEYVGLKKELMKKYKFAICFENAKNFEGWVTEKIFHCFFSGCIPIYYGAKNISNIIPSNCYIDYKSFKNNKELINFLENMDQKNFDKYIKNISLYLSSKQFKNNFTLDAFSKKIFQQIKNDLNSINV